MLDIEDICNGSRTSQCSNQRLCHSIRVCVSSQRCSNSHTVAWYENTYDVVVIGAGVTGCSVARQLSRYKLKVLVLEKAYDVAQGASKANSGIVHGGYDAKYGSLKARLGYRGNQLFPQLNSELHFGFLMTGSLVLAFNEEERKTLQGVYQNGLKNGLLKENLEILDRDQVLALEPNVNPTVLCALRCKNAGITSPYEYTIALIENAIQNGVQLELEHEVIDVEHTEDEHYVIKTDKEYFKAKYVINCAGLYADKIAKMVGANNFAIVPRKGEYIVLHKNQGKLVNHVIFRVPSEKWGKGVLVSRTYWGNLLLGPTARDTDNPKQTDSPENLVKTNKQVMEYIVHTSRELVPHFDPTQAITSFTGLRSRVNQDDWIIEESKNAKGFINCAGIDSPGLTGSPAVAEFVVEILEKSCGAKLEKNENFSPLRPPIIITKDDTFDGEIDHPDPKKNIICRCERVTEAEIVDSIHRGIPVTSVDAVKKRTRAGMGRCQGTFCGDRVVRLISRETGIPVKFIPKLSQGSSILPHKVVTEEDRELLAKL